MVLLTVDRCKPICGCSRTLGTKGSEHAVNKKILVLSDNYRVAKTIQLALQGEVEVVQIILAFQLQPQTMLQALDFDLIVVALSSYANEPVVALARTSLASFIGQIPLLIISDKPFETDLDMRIIHMDFPFALNALHERVKQILRGEFYPLKPGLDFMAGE